MGEEAKDPNDAEATAQVEAAQESSPTASPDGDTATATATATATTTTTGSTTTTSKPKKEKKIPEGLVIPPKKPKATKAERRALQEQQRAAKASAHGDTGARNEVPKQGSGGKPEAVVGSAPPPPAAVQANAKRFENESVAAVSGTEPFKAAPAATSFLGQAQPAVSQPIASSSSRINTLVPTMAPYRNPADIFHQGALLRPAITGTLKEGSHHQWHPAVVALGYKYATGEIRGGNNRCRHMLSCFEILVQDFVVVVVPGEDANATAPAPAPTAAVDYRHVLDQQILKSSFQFWTEQCRPHSVSMGNAFTALKAAVASLDRNLPLAEMKAMLLETISAYRRERIDYADQAIADLAHTKLLHGSSSGIVGSVGRASPEEEVILTYGYSEVVDLTLRQAAASSEEKCHFRVIVVDSEPLLEGRRLLTQLRTYAPNIECTYVMLHALTYVLDDVTKVLLGASALMSDGSVWGRAGAACVALAAHSKHIPVLVCSETYKISNRVQLESLTSNELGSPYDYFGGSSSSSSTLGGGDATPRNYLKQLDLLYDLTPSAFVSGIVTELGIIPPSSVAVLLRELNQTQEG